MGSRPRMTLTTQLVLKALLERPLEERYGLEICSAAGLPSGTIHPILARLEQVGWVESRWEEGSASEKGRPRRRYYRLTQDGAQQARTSLAEATASTARLTALRPHLAPGA